MCKVGCDKLWNIYKEADKKCMRYHKISNICFWTMFSMSMINFLLWVFDISVPLEGDNNYRVIEAIGVTYWHWWYVISYFIPFTYVLYASRRQKMLRKLKIEIHCGERSSFVNDMLFQEALIANGKKGK